MAATADFRLVAGAAGILIAMANPVSAQVYKCSDSTGNVVYSGKPCEYADKPLDLTDNAVQGRRQVDRAERGATAVNSVSDGSPECLAAQRDLLDETAKPIPAGIVDANRQRAKVNQLSRRFEAACGISPTTGDAPRHVKPKADDDSAPPIRCYDGRWAASYEACGQSAGYGKPTSRCLDGTTVRGKCARAPDGSYYGR